MDIFAPIGSLIGDIWTLELTRVDGDALTLGRVVVAFTLLVLSITISRRFSRLVGRRLLSRFDLSIGAQALVETVLFYLLTLLTALLALRLANVPLTAFAVLGGAIAIGVGFGSQNIINNFISGLILMLEQPVRVGDLIEVGSADALETGDGYGTIEHIGARSTVVRRVDNTHVVLPNSTLLQNMVVNLTLESTLMRSQVRVGVAYGSNTQQVRELLLKVAADHRDIRAEPETAVVFSDFGASSLDFDLIYWHRLDRAFDRRRIASDLRFAINEVFANEGVVIAFPQRDLHLHTSVDQPIAVALQSPQR